MYGSDKVRKLFQRHCFTIRPTGSDSSHQLGPVKRTHRTVANSICAQLFGVNIDIRCWPCYFGHTLRLLNANSCTGINSSRLEAAFGRRDNFKNLKYFGSRVWCRPLVILMPNSSQTQERVCSWVFSMIRPRIFFIQSRIQLYQGSQPLPLRLRLQ